MSEARARSGSATADWAPGVLMCVALKSGFAMERLMAAKFMGADIGSWWAWAFCEAKAAATPLVVSGK